MKKRTGHGGKRDGAGAPKKESPRNVRRMISWTTEEWIKVEGSGGDDLAQFQRDAILDRCK